MYPMKSREIGHAFDHKIKVKYFAAAAADNDDHL